MSKDLLKHKLQNRHLQMIALGGAIGTGLFFGTTKSLHLTGPSIILAYVLGGIVMYIIMRALGEMTVDHPSSGSFSEYANRYVGPYAGFISGWSAWFEYTVVCMVELTAVTVFFDYLVPGIPHWALCLGVLVFFTIVNLLSVQIFGEFEFWFAGIKIVAIIAMILFAIYLLIFKHVLTPGVTQYITPHLFFAGGVKGFAISLVIVVFSFGGTEFVGIAAGEAKDPHKSVPKAINGVIFRILLFYISTIFIIMLLYPYQKLSTNISPFVDVFKQIGFSNAAYIMDIVAITAALSAFNSCLYSSSRMLYNLSTHGYAPKFLSNVTHGGHIPKSAILLTSSVVLIGVVVNYLFPKEAIMYLLLIATGSILIVWFMILLTQLYFRKYKTRTNGVISYKLKLTPYSTLFAMAMLIIVSGIMLEIDDMRRSIYIAPLWVVMLSIIYIFTRAKSAKSTK